VTYAGLFQLRGVPQKHVQPLVLIECPRLLFPDRRRCDKAGRFSAADNRPGGFYGALSEKDAGVGAQAQQQTTPPS
jgi:hypothetical protein